MIAFDTFDSDHAHVREGAYRKGFVQGATLILQQIESGACPDEIRAYICGPLSQWRYDKPFTIFQPPPEMGHDCGVAA